MQRAIELGQQARYWSAPNPPVGCVLVRDDQEIGAGFTQPAGQAHAEVMALNAAGGATDATAYVTLEPCSHQGQTGPCASALIDAGVARVVVALEDPRGATSARVSSGTLLDNPGSTHTNRTHSGPHTLRSGPAAATNSGFRTSRWDPACC